MIDPHTACGYYLLEQMPRDPLTPRVLLSTASPYKFPRVVNEALASTPPAPTSSAWMCWPTRPAPPPRPLRGLETADVRFKDVVAIEAWKITSKRPPRRCDSPLTALTDNSQPIHALPACIGFLFSDVTSRRSRHVQACPSLVTRGFLAAFHLQRANGVLLVFSRKRESPCCRRTGKSMWFVRFCSCN